MQKLASYCIGLTGGIGSGKSTVVAFFKEYGASIIDADSIARTLVEPDNAAYSTLIEHFSNAILETKTTHSHLINRQKLRQIIFNNPAEQKWLENYLHPLIRQEIQQQLEILQEQGVPYVIVDIPLLKKRSDYPFLNRVLVIDCPEALQIERVMQRDHVSAIDVHKILRKQISRTLRNRLADDRIMNNGDLEALKIEVHKLHEQYLTHT